MFFKFGCKRTNFTFALNKAFMDIQKEKAELIEMFGIHFESLYHLSPLGSRILGTLILDCCGKGMTFETLVDKMDASKSSVSTNLNLLLKRGKITYYKEEGSRKKYFKPSPFSERLSNYIRIIDFEKQLIDRMFNYRKKTIGCSEEQSNLENIAEYKSHVLKIEQLMRQTIQRFKEIENNKQQDKPVI
jgi:DNA-binding transcriptional regulator GbsR (MarR family)